jgi:triosephosphate isomerase
MRTPFFAGNWKMFKTVAEARAFATEFVAAVAGIGGADIVLAPPFTAIHALADATRDTNVSVAAQDVYWEKEGAFTGEVSPGMLVEAGARYAIIGHSERRRLFADTDSWVNRKTRAALGAGLVPIVCIGETLEEREAHQTLDVLDRQITVGLDGMHGTEVAGLVLAYEPVWAIGTGRNASPKQAGEAHTHIRQRLRQWFGADAAEACRVLYGGSVKADNIASLRAEPDVDGALVGGASLDAKSFAGIVRNGLAR